MNIPLELFSTFNKAKFYEIPHKYYVDGEDFVSVTTLLHRFEPEFESEYWAEYKAKQFDLKPETFKQGWKYFNEIATTKGSLLHLYAENLWNNKIFEYPEEEIVEDFGYDPIRDEYTKSKTLIDKFYRDSFNKIILIRNEMIVYDELLKIAGMMDLLFWNVRDQEFQIYDWKSNNDFTFENKKGNLFHELQPLEACDLEIYSIQLGIYKAIIERNTNIKIGKCFLIWISSHNDNYKIIPIKDRSFYVNEIFENRMLNLN